jgi:hypothetical protein
LDDFMELGRYLEFAVAEWQLDHEEGLRLAF